MKTETKIALACFIGGAIGTTVALLIPSIVLVKVIIGAITGFAAGYIGYEFKEVWTNIPIAWAKTTKELSIFGKKVVAWLKVPHPHTYPWIVSNIIINFLVILHIASKESDLANFIAGYLILSCGGFMFSWAIYLVAIMIPANEGEEILKCIIEDDYSETTAATKMGEGYTLLPLSYRNVYRIIGAGYLSLSKKFRKWAPLKAKKCLKALGTIFFFCLFGWIVLSLKFFINLIKIIHSKERVLCGVWTAIGVIAACIIGVTTETSVLLLIPIGGIIGAFTGVLSYKLISVKLLKINIA
jgi:hypothetical protein